MSSVRPVRRVLVALDGSPGSFAAARAAIELAARLEAELVGLFVEDGTLLSLSRSPMARQVGALTGDFEPLRTSAAERQLRVQAGRARAALARLAEARGLGWSFRVARGSVSAEIVAAAGEADLVSLGRIGWSLRRRQRLGSTARALLGQRHRRTLLLERALDLRPPVVTLYDGGEPAREALELGRQLMAGEPGQLTVLLVGGDDSALRAEVEEALGDTAGEALVLGLGRPRAAEIVRLVQRHGGGLLIVPVGESGPGEADLEELLDAVDCPVLAVS